MSGYFLFAGQSYYPGGGWSDFIGTFGSLDEAKHEIDKSRHMVRQGAGYTHPREYETADHDWAHIVHDGQIVASIWFASYPVDANEWRDGS